MHLHTNHCWCSDCNWGGNYDCRNMIVIERYRRDDKTYKDEDDWTNLTEEFKHENPDSPSIFSRTVTARRLKPEVIKWLEENVKDRVGENHTKGWCVGTDDYLARATTEITIFFHRRLDALKFVKVWSKYKKITSYYNHFTGRRLRINPKTNTLQKW